MSVKKQTVRELAEAIIDKVGNLVPEYYAMPKNAFSEGNVAICIIDEEMNVYGKLFGTNKIRMRRASQIAWTKASQVWITRMKTVDFEKKVFNGEVNAKDFGIDPPDFIGWLGGQPVELKDGTYLSVGFSGFKGESDLEIVTRAIGELSI
jgi:uncharacterized protein GlcG (DUF336 family)